MLIIKEFKSTTITKKKSQFLTSIMNEKLTPEPSQRRNGSITQRGSNQDPFAEIFGHLENSSLFRPEELSLLRNSLVGKVIFHWFQFILISKINKNSL